MQSALSCLLKRRKEKNVFSLGLRIFGRTIVLLEKVQRMVTEIMKNQTYYHKSDYVTT